MPASYHIAQELQKYNIPDYRPRQEQCVQFLKFCRNISWSSFPLPIRFQKAIKKVRAVQRMRRNRGFAFSQTENGTKQDQAKMIRAYDTSQSHAKPSGYWSRRYFSRSILCVIFTVIDIQFSLYCNLSLLDSYICHCGISFKLCCACGPSFGTKRHCRRRWKDCISKLQPL